MSMSAHGDESSDREKPESQEPESQEDKEKGGGGGLNTSVMPEPDEDAQKEAERIMEAYEDRPTLVMPGSGKTITGTAVSNWLDDDGNPKFADDEDSPAAKANFDPAEIGKDQQGDGERGDDGNEVSEDAKVERRYQSERSEAADENAEDKSIEQINKEAQEAVKENFEKDKEFNAAVLKEAKERSSASS